MNTRAILARWCAAASGAARRGRFTALVAASAFVVAGAPFTGCAKDPSDGWSMQSAHPQGYRTVAVGIFENRTYERDISRNLTDAIVKEIQQSTPYRVTSPAKADTVLRGSIRHVKLRELSKSLATGLSEEMVMQVTVDYEWVDMRTGKPIVSRQGFSGSGTFISSLPQTEPIDLGGFNAVQQMAADIVASMQADW